MTAALLIGPLPDRTGKERGAVAWTMDLSTTPGPDWTPDAAVGGGVRAQLARQLAATLPGLSRGEYLLAAGQVQAALAATIRDGAARARAADAALAPDLDGESPGCATGMLARIIPLLTGADLLTLLAAPSPAGQASLACALLAGRCPGIQEAMLDALVRRWAAGQDGDKPLPRPELSHGPAMALHGMLASSQPGQAGTGLRLPPTPANRDADRHALAQVRRLDAAGLLDEAALLAAARQGDARLVAAILAAASGLPLAAIDRAGRLRSAKALVSLAWKSGFTMRAARVAQALLGQLAADSTLPPDAEGGFPLSPNEMEWQIDLLRGHAGCHGRS